MERGDYKELIGFLILAMLEGLLKWANTGLKFLRDFVNGRTSSSVP